MKYLGKVSLLTIALVVFSSVKGQETIIESLQSTQPSEGAIEISAAPEINALIGRTVTGQSSTEYIKANGFRIQLYSGNTAKTSKEEAFRRQELINEEFPDVSTYVTYQAPYWRLRVGDFRTQEEAYLLMKQITKEMSTLKKESYVVKDEIKVLLTKTKPDEVEF